MAVRKKLSWRFLPITLSNISCFWLSLGVPSQWVHPWVTAAGEVTLLLTADPAPLPAEESVAAAAEAAAEAAAAGVTKSCRHFLTRFLARLAR